MPISAEFSVSALLIAFIGAAAVLGGHYYVQRKTAERERRSSLRTAYAEFGAAAFEYLDYYDQNRVCKQHAEYEMTAAPDEEPDWYHQYVGDKTMTLQKSYALLRDSKARLNVARCRVLLLEPDALFRGKLNHVHGCLVEYEPMRLGPEAEEAFQKANGEGKAWIMQRDMTDFLMTIPSRKELQT